jgi:signal transduction histidine kinase
MHQDAPDPVAFLEALCHRLGTSVGTLVNHVHLLALDAKEAPAPLREAVAGVERATAGLRRLLEGARRWMAAAYGELTPVALDPGALLETRAARRGPREDQARLVVRVEGPVPRVRADATALATILDELLDNAAASAAPDATVTATLRGTASGGRVRLELDDDGPGWEGADLERVRRAFVTWPAGADRPGVGLALAEHLVTRMGGSLTPATHTGKGARVRLELPTA